MTVFLYTLKRLLKNKVMLVFMLVFPLIAISPGAKMATQSSGIGVGIVNNDRTVFTNDLEARLSKNFTIVRINKDEVRSSLENARITYAIEIPKGFTEDIISGKSPEISGYGLTEKDCSKIVGAAIDSFVYPSKMIAAKAQGQSTAFYAAVEKIPPAQTIPQKKDNTAAFKLMIQCIFMASIFAATVLIKDKESKTFYRSFQTPVSMRNYMLQSILCFFLISLVQIAFLYPVVVYGLGIDPGKHPLNVLIVLVVTALTSVAMGVAVSSVCKSTIQATGVGLGIVVVMCMFGGAWGMTPTKPLITGISKIMPFYWSSEALGKVMDNKVLTAAGGDLLILLAFAAVFFLAGTWRKTDIQK